jgi:hypothetical protein
MSDRNTENEAFVAIGEAVRGNDRRMALVRNWVRERFEASKDALVDRKDRKTAQGEARAWREIKKMFDAAEKAAEQTFND